VSDEFATAKDQVRQLLLKIDDLVAAAAGGALKGRTPRWRRVELRPVLIKSTLHLQVSRFDEQQSFTENVPVGGPELRRVVDELLDEPFGKWHVASTAADFAYRVTQSGKTLVTQHGVSRERDLSHDRAKRRLLDPTAPFLRELGLTDEKLRVRPSRTDKYRQVEEFVRVLDVAVREMRTANKLDGEPIRVVDLGCGNAYLTFAAYHHLHVMLDLPVHMVGVDVKGSAARRNNEIARKLGWEDRLEFVQGEIATADVAGPVAMTLALHACDTATDDAIARGIEWGSDLILAAPCCHHDIQRQLKAAEAPAPYALLTRSGIVRERWGDLLTDSLRAHLLRRAGYRTDVIEFVASKHTPRNVLVRALRTGSGPSEEQEREYLQLIEDWQVRPRLAQLMGGTQ
jgi:SAM-dependent methyltransferase